MCGLTGFIDQNRQTEREVLRSTVRRMADTLRHRGPNDDGDWVDPACGVALGFRRLSIMDLSEHGHQPMHSESGRYVLVFNGELYNFQHLRKQLEARDARPFRGHSDTEVMLRAVECWGLEEALRQSVGMFAFALWDRTEENLHLGRDRLGEKPLYYGWMGNTFLFGSELKALKAHPAFRAEIDRDALAAFLRYGYLPAPASIYRGISKLPPGMTLTVQVTEPAGASGPAPYWSAPEIAKVGHHSAAAESDAETIDRLDNLLREAVGQQMVADVPLGAFLSGGIDSSTVVALMQALSPRPVKTFTIGFHEARFNEAEYARQVAHHLGTDHTELYVTPAEAMAVIPRLPALYDEPFADPSQIPTFLVSQLARQQVTVSLSGDGGDELFAGYAWYFRAIRIWNRLRWVPSPVRRVVARALACVSPGGWDRAFDCFRSLVPARLARQATGDRVHKFGELIAKVRGPESVYECLVSAWIDPPLVGTDGAQALGRPGSEHADGMAGDPLPRLMVRDMTRYLPDNILTKVDRASMGVGLESRAPLLDHRVVEFAWRLPRHMKVRHGKGKWALRQVLSRYVPPALVERPKMGFCVPIDSWLRGPLREWAEELLEEGRLRRQGYFDPGTVRQKWQEHTTGCRNWQHHLWSVLMFQGWLESQ